MKVDADSVTNSSIELSEMNLNDASYTCQAAARQIVKQGHGGAINSISPISVLAGGAPQTKYTPTTAGASSLMQSTVIALGKDNILCNASLPGTIKTQLSEEGVENDMKKS
jgi:L-rhamnose 1-dehydrogenase